MHARESRATEVRALCPGSGERWGLATAKCGARGDAGEQAGAAGGAERRGGVYRRGEAVFAVGVSVVSGPDLADEDLEAEAELALVEAMREWKPGGVRLTRSRVGRAIRAGEAVAQFAHDSRAGRRAHVRGTSGIL